MPTSYYAPSLRYPWRAALDALGSPVAATDQQGNVVWREDYEPYGNRIRNETAAQANTHWYTGHPHDSKTGLTYMGARYYDPTLGRFMGIDPKDFTEGNPHSFNRYAYGNNNPYKYIDPDGQVPIVIFAPLIWTGSGAAISGGINAAVQFVTSGAVQWGGIGGVLDAAGDGAMLGPVFGAAGAARGGVTGDVAKGTTVYRQGTFADDAVGWESNEITNRKGYP